MNEVIRAEWNFPDGISFISCPSLSWINYYLSININLFRFFFSMFIIIPFIFINNLLIIIFIFWLILFIIISYHFHFFLHLVLNYLYYLLFLLLLFFPNLPRLEKSVLKLLCLVIEGQYFLNLFFPVKVISFISGKIYLISSSPKIPCEVCLIFKFLK